MESTVNEYGRVKIGFTKVPFCATGLPSSLRDLKLTFSQPNRYIKFTFWNLTVDVEAECTLSELIEVMEYFPFLEPVFRNLKVSFPKEYSLLSIIDKYKKDKADTDIL